MKFKEEKLKEEFWGLVPKMRMILCDVEYYMAKKYGVEMVITSIYRDDNIGSTHYWWRASDVRSLTLNRDEIDDIVKYVKGRYPYGDGKHDTILYHDVGQGEHFHVQTINEGELVWRK